MIHSPSMGRVEITMLQEMRFILNSVGSQDNLAPGAKSLFLWCLFIPAKFDFEAMCADSKPCEIHTIIIFNDTIKILLFCEVRFHLLIKF